MHACALCQGAALLGNLVLPLPRGRHSASMAGIFGAHAGHDEKRSASIHPVEDNRHLPWQKLEEKRNQAKMLYMAKIAKYTLSDDEKKEQASPRAQIAGFVLAPRYSCVASVRAPKNRRRVRLQNKFGTLRRSSLSRACF